VNPQPHDHDQGEGEENPIPEFRDFPGVPKGGDHGEMTGDEKRVLCKRGEEAHKRFLTGKTLLDGPDH
jgi:hypothetical protein